MGGDCNVMLTVLDPRQAHMASGLAGYFVTENLKFFGEVFSRQVPREPHTAMVSSRTKCNRMTFGILVSSKWHLTASRIIP